MKKYLCMMALTLVMGAAAAQEPDNQQQPKQAPTVEQMAKMKADRMKQHLLLGDDQYDKVYKLCLKQSEAQQKRMEQMKKEQEEMSQQMSVTSSCSRHACTAACPTKTASPVSAWGAPQAWTMTAWHPHPCAKRAPRSMSGTTRAAT